MEADPVHLVEGNIDMPQLPGMKTPPFTLRGFQQLGKLIQGVKFSDGVAVAMNEEEQNLVRSAT